MAELAARQFGRQHLALGLALAGGRELQRLDLGFDGGLVAVERFLLLALLLGGARFLPGRWRTSAA
ncbi:MAG: hypothetical protein QM702_24090 [Rubrivivax sp.]